MQREQGTAPDGKSFDGHWVARDLAGALIDYDQYRDELFTRLGITRG